MAEPETREPQNQPQIDAYRAAGPAAMGPWTSHIWRSDPRHLAFMLARYKFCAKMLEGKQRVLEAGCGDAFGTRLVAQTVGCVHAVDFEPLVLDDARARMAAEGEQRISFEAVDLTRTPPVGRYDAAYSLDVIEHVPAETERAFLDNLCAVLVPHAVLIVGTPNLCAQEYASAASREGHVNLKTAATLRDWLARRFVNVFGFSMNDEVVHTGYAPMAHYLLAMAVGLKD